MAAFEKEIAGLVKSGHKIDVEVVLQYGHAPDPVPIVGTYRVFVDGVLEDTFEFVNLIR